MKTLRKLGTVIGIAVGVAACASWTVAEHEPAPSSAPPAARPGPLPPLDAATGAFLEKARASTHPPIHTLSVEDARNALRGAQSGAQVARFEAHVEDKTIPGAGPGGRDVSVRIYRPSGVQNALPVVLYFHGGGWVLGGVDTHDRLAREIVQGAQAAVVFVNYTLAPDAQYPVQLEEGFAALRWIAEQGRAHRLDPTRVALAGDSAGGNLAIAVAMITRERKGPDVKALALFYPVTDARFDTASYEAYEQGWWLSRPAMRWFWDHYAPDEADRAKPTASPLRAPLATLAGLPPTLVITAEHDVLRDEGEAFARRLTEAGVNTVAARYIGTIHDFVMLDALAESPGARAAVSQANSWLRRAFR